MSLSLQCGFVEYSLQCLLRLARGVILSAVMACTWCAIAEPAVACFDDVFIQKKCEGVFSGEQNTPPRFLFWRDDNSILYNAGSVVCCDTIGGEEIWRYAENGKVGSMSFRSGVLSIVTRTGDIVLLSIATGQRLSFVSYDDWKRITGDSKAARPSFVTGKSATEIVILTEGETFSGNGYIVNFETESVTGRFSVDPLRLYCDLSNDNECILVATLDGLLSVRSMKRDSDVFVSRDRIEQPTGRVADDSNSYGQSFYDERRQILVTSKRNGWQQGKLIIRRFSPKSEQAFDFGTGYDPIDVDFEKDRILSMNSRGVISVFSFDGRSSVVDTGVLGKCLHVRYSPSKRLFMTSGSERYCVFSIE